MDDDSLVGEAVAHFSVLRVLGRGGMGVVYEALDEKLGRNVALKVLPESFAADPSRKARFLREARAAAQISHPSIATVFEIGESNGRLYIAMELVGGTTLRSRLDASPLSADEALDIARQMASALAKAHGAGIVHRDLKPENVMLDEEGNVKLLDFGIAKALGDDEKAPFTTREGAILGTPGYMAPEQASGKRCDQRADVFAFGVMLHEMLSGVAPFRGETPLELVASVLRDEASPLPETVRTTPDIRALVTRCLEKSPDARPNDGRTLLELLGGKAPRAVVRAQATAIDPLAKTMATPEAQVIQSQTPAPPPALPQVTPSKKRPWLWLLAGILVASGTIAIVSRLKSSARQEVKTARTFQSAHEERPPRPPPRREGGGEGPPLFLCDAKERGDAGFGRNCDVDTFAFCDPHGQPVACCAKGLFPVGVDGVCSCPPGGGGPDAPGNCRSKHAASADSESLRTTVREHTPEFHACIDTGHAKGRRVRGKVRFAIQISPDGRVYSARIESSSLPAAAVQTCALEVWKKMRFKPPPGTAGLTVIYPIDFDSD